MLGTGQRSTLAQRAMFEFMLSPGNTYERGVRSCDARVYVSVNLYPRSCLGTVSDLNRTSKGSMEPRARCERARSPALVAEMVVRA
jgi:hypothetical protein